MVKCKICCKKYVSISSLNRHRNENHGPKKLCPYCFNFYGQLNPHFLICKKYQRYQLTKLKIIGREIFYVNENDKKSTNYKLKTFIPKKDLLKDAKQINKSNFYFIPHMKIGEGAYCKVFLGINTKTNQECAIKFFTNTKSNIEKFIMEESMLKNLKESISFPSLFYSSYKNLILAESLTGPNLRQLFEFCDKKFPLRTVYFIVIEMISRLQEFHSRGFVHRDIKPTNFVWGKFIENFNELKDHILLIDYDLSRKYINKEKSHIFFKGMIH